MKVFLVFICLFPFTFIAKSQTSNTDSLLQVIRTSNDVQTRLETARYYTWHYVFKNTDSINYGAEQLLEIGQKFKYLDMQVYGKAFFSYSYNVKGDIYKALSLAIEALKLAEQKPNDLLFSYVYNSLGNIYFTVNLEKSLRYYRKGLAYVEQANSQVALIQKNSLLVNLSNCYRKRNQLDSALILLNRAQENRLQIKDNSLSIGTLYNELGKIYLLLNQPKLAYYYYQLDLQKAKQFKQPREVRVAFEGMGYYHFKTANPDSAIFYYQKYFSIANQDKGTSWQIEPALAMYKIYKKEGAEKEALKYLEMYNAAKAEEDSTAQIQLTQGLSFEEDMRQQELAEAKTQELEERKHNLQYAAIGLGLVSFLVIFLLLSHSIIANQKVIRYLGVIALLIVFEFLNLLLHPFLGKVTHHSPVLMLLAMVCLAAVLIPFHHKLEHWITHKMVEKNNKIRLAAAKKTLEELEQKVIIP